METGSTAHFWAQKLVIFAHQIKTMPPSYVKAYVRRGKNDAVDVEAIWEPIARPNSRFAPIKIDDPQAGLILHKVRELLMRQRHIYAVVISTFDWISLWLATGSTY